MMQAQLISTQVGSAENAHARPEFLELALSEDLRHLSEMVGEGINLEPFGLHKAGVDTTTKMLVKSDSGRRIAVIICSRPAAPDLIARGTQAAESIRSIIGHDLGEPIIKPISSSYADGLSCVILPNCREFSSSKLVRAAQRLHLRRSLLNWLCQATEAAALTHGTDDSITHSYARMLQHIKDQDVFDESVRSAARCGLRRLESRRWQPRQTIDHNDFWLGNIMLIPKADAGARYPFVLIDWAGANARGFGIYDLTRVARSLKLSAAAFRRELIGHSEALQCQLEDTRGHFLASLGRLHQHLEHFPEERYLKLFRQCWSYLNRALSDRH